MFYVVQFRSENVYILDCSNSYVEALRLRKELADQRPSRWYEVVPEKEMCKVF